jgi:DNA-binding LytR/AlgR family response regulator
MAARLVIAEHLHRELAQIKVMLDYFLEQEQLFLPPHPHHTTIPTTVSTTVSTTPTTQEVFSVKDGRTVLRVHPAEILYCQAEDHFTLIHTTAGTSLMTGEPLSVWESRLSTCGFVRIHRSLLVNLQHCRGFAHNGKKGTAFMAGQDPHTTQELPVSRSYKRPFVEAYERFSSTIL